MNVDELAPEALKLPIRERAILAAFLWESLDDPYAKVEDLDDEEALALAEKRDEEIESGAVKPLTHAELMSRLRK
ncbi:putative addiction module component (TIGR02574 family) [Roseimicrobium gellanilyticum]|uniref:Putative addiction module component (TIGR02574 family) n=1 Tax=Roseimicrobium gellanilyticum TaxID=748857 RepID=A0A366HBF5_9BACT|nr:addiction module protein [Roseimicrobium gellanilyticum]RBP39088.1 putative addiction module component (TIGR02574 family) [Roseimicrobium gellanilyticum]